MKAIGLNVDTGEVREFDSAEEAMAYASSKGYIPLGGGTFPLEAKDDVIEMARAIFGRNEVKDEPEVAASKAAANDNSLFEGVHKTINDAARRSTVKLDNYSGAVANALHAAAHAFYKQGNEIADMLDADGEHERAFELRNTRNADFSFLHGLADLIVSGEETGASIVEQLRQQG